MMRALISNVNVIAGGAEELLPFFLSLQPYSIPRRGRPRHPAAQFQPETGNPEGCINFASILHRSLATMQDDITND
jgi:hypothetical protein